MNDTAHLIGMMVDPPGGWAFGFPKKFVPRYEGQSLEEWLREQGVPQSIIDLGHMRFWQA